MAGTWSQAGFATIAQLVTTRTGIAIGPQVHEHIERAARRTMGKLDIDEVGAFAYKVAYDSTTFDELVDEISVGETYFFRDPSHFDLVRSMVLPALIVAGTPCVRVWSAGCASGEEAYSLAILLSDQGVLDRSFVLATDISQRALRLARAGRYREWSFRGFDPALAGTHLRGERGSRVVSDRIRAAVLFAALNLADDCYPGPSNDTHSMQLIFCRNVLMYLRSETIARVERRLFDALAPGGYLFLGPSDPIFGTHAPFEVLITPQGGLCYRRPLEHAGTTLPKPRAQESTFELFAPVPVDDAESDSDWRSGSGSDSSSCTRAESRSDSVSDSLVTQARAAAARADHAGVIALATAHPADIELAALHVRALWNLLGANAAEALCAGLARTHELAVELHYLHALVLLELGRDREATASLRRTLYLDRSLIIAHFTLGSVCARSGELDAARGAYRNAQARCAALPAKEAIVLGDGIRAGGLGMAAANALAALGEA